MKDQGIDPRLIAPTSTARRRAATALGLPGCAAPRCVVFLGDKDSERPAASHDAVPWALAVCSCCAPEMRAATLAKLDAAAVETLFQDWRDYQARMAARVESAAQGRASEGV